MYTVVTACGDKILSVRQYCFAENAINDVTRWGGMMLGTDGIPMMCVGLLLSGKCGFNWERTATKTLGYVPLN